MDKQCHSRRENGGVCSRPRLLTRPGIYQRFRLLGLFLSRNPFYCKLEWRIVKLTHVY